jgi:prepilin-type N-terminal cleavage/methylation domain-containing protein
MQIEDKKEQGFTLIELLVAIVVVGILTAVAIVGIGGLTNKGESSACSATKDAVKAAQSVHYSNNDGVYPTTFQQMVTDKELELSGNTSIDGSGNIAGTGWTLTGSGTGTAPMTLGACPA